MLKKTMGILLSVGIVLGGFMADGTVACAYDHGITSEYCELELMERFDEMVQRCDEINKLFENGTLGILFEDGTTYSENPEATKYLVRESVATAFWTAQETFLWNDQGTALVDRWDVKHYLWDEDTDGISNWNEDGYLTSVKRSEFLGVIDSMNAAVQPIWDLIHPASKESKPRRSKSAAEKEAEKEARRKAEEEKRLLEEASREAVRLEGEAAKQGFVNGAQMQDAKAAGKSSDEYYNNAVTTTPGIENAVPVAQGGQLVIDGKTTNATATIEKVTSAYVDSIRAAREGTLLNVVQVSYPAAEAAITFYMPGVQAEDNIVAAQYVDGAWTDVEVTQVRADHVTLNMKGNGVVAFLKK